MCYVIIYKTALNILFSWKLNCRVDWDFIKGIKLFSAGTLLYKTSDILYC